MDTDATPPRRGRPPGREGRELLAVAREVFLDRGFAGTTMDAVAARARVSKQSLYAAYPSKGALYEAVVRDWVDLGYDALAPHTQALAHAGDVRSGLLRFAGVLQAGILSTPVLQMRTLVAAQADAFPQVAADYAIRSWDRNISHLAQALRTLHDRDLLDVDDLGVAAEQFVWLVIGAPLNRLSLQGLAHRDADPNLQRTATEAVATFLSRYRRPH
jgi:TetR/AcrR family transcriptional repressor of mexJK operon